MWFICYVGYFSSHGVISKMAILYKYCRVGILVWWITPRGENTARGEAEGGIVPSRGVIHHANIPKRQYLFYYTECLLRRHLANNAGR